MKLLSFCRRLVVLTTCAVAIAPLHVAAQGSWQPERTIRLVVPFAAGASTDSVARTLAAKLSTRLGQTVVVENKGGAGGSIGTDLVVKAPPDGYTLLFASTSIITAAAQQGKRLPYDPLKDLTPISEVGAVPFLIVVSPTSTAMTLGELIAQARAKPRSLSYGTGGVATITHLATELFASVAKIELLHIPYKGVGESYSDLVSGRLHLLLPTVAVGIPQIRAGKMRGLAVTSRQRSPLAPDLPTVAEAGIPGFEVEAWWAVLGPARLPAPIVKRLNQEIAAVLAQPDVQETLSREGAIPRSGTPEALGTLMQTELARWTRVIKEANIQAD